MCVRSNLADIRVHNVTDLLKNCVRYNLQTNDLFVNILKFIINKYEIFKNFRDYQGKFILEDILVQHLTSPIYSHKKVLLTIYRGGLLLSKRQQTRLKLQFGSVFPYQGKNFSFFLNLRDCPCSFKLNFYIYWSNCGGALFSKFTSNSQSL